MIWLMVCSAFVVTLSMLALMAVVLILSADDDVSIFSDKHPIHAPAEPDRRIPPHGGSGMAPPRTARTDGRIVNVPIDAIRDDRCGTLHIAQDALAARRRKASPTAAPAPAEAACDEPGAFILPFGEVGVWPDSPDPDPAPPAGDGPAASGFGGMGGGDVISDVGGDW
jgi:hypothetical protein